MTLNGTNLDIVVNANQTNAVDVNFTAQRNVIINANLATTTGNITLVGGSAFGGVGAGGVLVTSNGQVSSAGTLTVQGKDVFNTTTPANDAINLQGPVTAAGAISLSTLGATPCRECHVPGDFHWQCHQFDRIGRDR